MELLDLNQTVSIGLFDYYYNISQKPSSSYCAKVSSETFVFLMKNPFGRGTVTINSRIQFNYEFAHRFFLFFFVFYANNIGKYFDQFSNVTYDLLSSVRRTSVMTSILLHSSKSSENFHLDTKYLSSLFSELVHFECDLDGLNDEPPNEALGP